MGTSINPLVVSSNHNIEQFDFGFTCLKTWMLVGILTMCKVEYILVPLVLSSKIDIEQFFKENRKKLVSFRSK